MAAQNNDGSNSSNIVPLKPVRKVIEDNAYQKLEEERNRLLKSNGKSVPNFDHIFDGRTFTINDENEAQNSRLEDIIKKINREGQLEKVVTVLENVELRLKEHKDDHWVWWLITPKPLNMVKDIEILLAEESVTKDFNKFLYKSWKLDFVLPVYGFFMFICSLAAIVITALNPGMNWCLIIVLVCVGCLSFQVWFFKDTMNNIVFLKIYEHICAVFENAYRDHLQLVVRTYQLRQEIEIRKLESKRNREINCLQVAEKMDREGMELEAKESLLHLNAMVALYTEATEAQKKILRNVGDLDRLRQERHIMDEKEEKDRAHELALAYGENLTRVLVEKAKFIGEDDRERREEKRKLEYNISLLTNMKNAFQTHQNGAFANESLYQSLEKVTNDLLENDNNGESSSAESPQQRVGKDKSEEMNEKRKNPRKI